MKVDLLARMRGARVRYLSPGTGTGVNYIQNPELSSGTWCATTWKRQPDGSSVLVDNECIGIWYG